MKKLTVFIPIRYRVRNRIAFEVPYVEDKNGDCKVYDKSGKLTSIITARDCSLLETKFNRVAFGFRGFNTLYGKFNKEYGRSYGKS